MKTTSVLMGTQDPGAVSRWRVLLLSELAAMLLACPSGAAEPPAPPSAPTAAAPADGIPAWTPPTTTPTTFPLVDAPGLTQFGFSGQVADRVALVALLRARQFDLLTRLLEDGAAAVEKDFHKELWMYTAFNAFLQSPKDIQELLDAWIQHNPASFAPYAARSRALYSEAFLARGDLMADKTKPEQFAQMRALAARALVDCDQALRISPQVVENRRWRIKVGMMDRSVDKKAAFQHAVALCRDCFSPYQAMMDALRPKWGGSYEEMIALAEAAVKASSNPAMVMLRGASHQERCIDLALTPETMDDAERSCDKALESGRWWERLKARGQVELYRKNFEKAQVWFDEALRQEPQRGDLLALRATILRRAGRWQEARNDVLLGLYVDPHEQGLIFETWKVARDVSAAAKARYDAKDWAGAIKLASQAIQLQPRDAEGWFWRGVARKNSGDQEGAFADFKEAVPLTRKWYPAYYELSAMYLKHNQLQDALDMWNRFLAENADSADGYYTRGGVHHRMKNRDAALADAQKACELKSTKGCKAAESLKSGKDAPPP